MTNSSYVKEENFEFIKVGPTILSPTVLVYNFTLQNGSIRQIVDSAVDSN